MGNESRRFPQRGAQRGGQQGQGPTPPPPPTPGQEEEQGAQGAEGQGQQGDLFGGSGNVPFSGPMMLSMVPNAVETIVNDLRSNPPHAHGGAGQGAVNKFAEAACEALIAALEAAARAAEAYQAAQHS